MDDGTTLVFEGEQPTVVVQRTPPPKKGKTLLWVGIIGLLIFGAIGIVGAYLVYNFFASDKNSTTQKINITNASPSPKVSATPKATPTANADSTPKKKDSTDTSEEILPISWNTNTSQFKGEAGQIYKFECPPNGIAGAVWGSDIYTGDTSICTAAVHVGLFTLEEGGIVTIEYRPGRQAYGSTERNGITSYTYGEYERSFVVR